MLSALIAGYLIIVLVTTGVGSAKNRTAQGFWLGVLAPYLGLLIMIIMPARDIPVHHHAAKPPAGPASSWAGKRWQARQDHKP